MEKFSLPASLLHQSVLLEVIEHLPAGVFAKDADDDYRFVIWNSEMENIFSNKRQDMLGRTDYDFFEPAEADYYRRTDEQAMANDKVVDIELEEVTTSNGQILAHTIKVPVQLNDGRRILLGILEDVTERETNRKNIAHYQTHLEELVAERTAELNKLASTDMLTGLWNRNAFFREVNALTNEGSNRPFTLIYMDLNRFKVVNDTHGHDFGDQLLAEFGRRLRALQIETISLFRVGGDEFAVLVDGEATDPNLDRICATIAALFDTGFEIGIHRYTIDASMGLSCYPFDALTPRQLLQNADMAMYAAKRGRRKLQWERYTTHLRAAVDRELEIEQGLRRALEKGELYLAYQPQYDANSHCNLQGLEALIRWNSPELGNVPPDVFIPVAENTGMIYRLSDFVLDTVCRDICAAKNLHISMPRVSVNMSAAELSDETAERIQGALTRYGLDASALTIEITENAKVKATQTVFDKLKPLRDQGLKLSIDDFGTGYSSLAYLSQLEIDEIKIDKSFIQAATNSQRDKSIVQAILGICDVFGYAIVAEGVETEEQAQLLAGRTDASLQGFWLGAPAPLQEVLAKLQERTNLQTR